MSKLRWVDCRSVPRASSRLPDRRPRYPSVAGAVLTVLLTSWAVAEPVAGQEGVAWLKEIQSPSPFLDPETATELPRLLPHSDDRPREASLAAWESERGRLRERWLDYLGPAARAERTPPDVEVIATETLDDGIVREHLQYTSEPGWVVEAYRLYPPPSAERCGGVVVFHSTVPHSIDQPAGVWGAPEKAFGLALARLGLVTICPRNYLWPENNRLQAEGQAQRFLEQHPESRGIAKMVHDGRLALDLLAADDRVDPTRLGAVGHSLGAKEVLYLAALDDRVAAAVFSEGGIGISMSNWDAPWYLGPEIHERPDLKHHQLWAMIAPRPFLVIGGNSADGDPSWPYAEAALEIYRLYSDPPRTGLMIHDSGHAVPPLAERRIHEWLTTYLAP